MKNIIKWIYNKLVIFFFTKLHVFGVQTIKIIYVTNMSPNSIKVYPSQVFSVHSEPHTPLVDLNKLSDMLFYDWLQF